MLRKLSEEPPGHAIVCSVGVGMDPNGNVRKFVTGVYPEDTKQLIDALLDVVEILAQWGRGEDPGESQPPEAKVK